VPTPASCELMSRSVKAMASISRRGRKRKPPRLVQRPTSPYFAIAYFCEKSGRTEYWSTRSSCLKEAERALENFYYR
jgi:hypothetical protein